MLDAVELADRASDRVASLSGGMVRRVALAQALLGSPRLLVLDEPAAGLDPDQRLRLRDRLSTLGEQATVVVSTHLTDEAAAVSTSVVVIDAGRLRFHGSPAQLTARAQGHVWISPQPPVSARRTWRLPDGSHRCIGDPPPGAQLVPPTMEDGYLMLVSDPAAAAAA